MSRDRPPIWAFPEFWIVVGIAVVIVVWLWVIA